LPRSAPARQWSRAYASPLRLPGSRLESFGLPGINIWVNGIMWFRPFGCDRRVDFSRLVLAALALLLIAFGAAPAAAQPSSKSKEELEQRDLDIVKMKKRIRATTKGRPRSRSKTASSL